MNGSGEKKRITLRQDGRSRVVEVDTSLPSSREKPDPARADIQGWVASMDQIQGERLSFIGSTNAATLGSGLRTTNELLEHQHDREVGLDS